MYIKINGYVCKLQIVPPRREYTIKGIDRKDVQTYVDIVNGKSRIWRIYNVQTFCHFARVCKINNIIGLVNFADVLYLRTNSPTLLAQSDIADIFGRYAQYMADYNEVAQMPCKITYFRGRELIAFEDDDRCLPCRQSKLCIISKSDLGSHIRARIVRKIAFNNMQMEYSPATILLINKYCKIINISHGTT